MAEKHEDTYVDPKLVILSVSGVHEKLGTGSFFFFFTAWYLNVIQEGKEGIREGDKFSLPHSCFFSLLLKAGQNYK